MIGIGIHLTVAIAFLALAIRTRPLIKIAHATIAAVNIGGIVRILAPEYANALEFAGLMALLIPFGIAMYLTIQLLAAPPKAHNEPI